MKDTKPTRIKMVVHHWCCGYKNEICNIIFLRSCFTMAGKLIETTKVILHWCCGYKKFIVKIGFFLVHWYHNNYKKLINFKKMVLKNCNTMAIRWIKTTMIKHHWCFGYIINIDVKTFLRSCIMTDVKATKIKMVIRH